MIPTALRYGLAALCIPTVGAATALGFHIAGPGGSLVGFLLAMATCFLLFAPWRGI